MDKYSLGSSVKYNGTIEAKGKVVGVTNYLDSPRHFLVLHLDKDGKPTQSWFLEAELDLVN